MLDLSNSVSNRNLQNAVVKKVLVLRVVGANGVQTTASEAELANKIFGASGDVLNLKSLYNQCSNGQLQFEPQQNNAIGLDGVYTVSLPNTIVTGADEGSIRDAAVAQASADFGDIALSAIADHVMVCLPPGTTQGGDWMAYSYMNHWLSVYNDDWCRSPSAQMHEIGTFILACYGSIIFSAFPDFVMTLQEQT
jgi:hypothetical protein